MRSFHHQPDNRRSIFLKLAGDIEGQLRQAFAKRSEKNGLTQAALADKLGIDRSSVNRRLSGGSNMTTETIADLVWGLGYCIHVDIFDPAETQSNGFHIVPKAEPEPLPAHAPSIIMHHMTRSAVAEPVQFDIKPQYKSFGGVFTLDAVK